MPADRPCPPARRVLPPLSRRSLMTGGLTAGGLALSLGLPPLRAGAATAPGWPLRKPSGPAQRSIHSGHSLTDSYLHEGDWPGDLRSLASSMGLRNPAEKFVRSVIPGSPLHWRWTNRVADSRPRDPSADARHDIAGFDTLVLTEGGPPARVQPETQRPQMVDSLDYLCRFVANALQRGAGGQGLRDILLWSIWPSLTLWQPDPPDYARDWQDFGSYRDALPEYGRSFEFMASYASWKMRQHFTDLPEDWAIFVIPGHRMIGRISAAAEAGELAGIRNTAALFRDDIHPDARCGYGLACLVLSCMYQRNLSEAPRLFRPRSLAPELQSWFTRTAWEVARSYAPAGLGGTESEGGLWQPEVMADPLPDWKPEV